MAENISSTIELIRRRVKEGRYRYTIHGFERSVERAITPDEIADAMLAGEIIEEYQQDKYSPSCLISGVTKEGRVIHVQCSTDPVWIITCYDPSTRPGQWEEDFKRRRKE